MPKKVRVGRSAFFFLPKGTTSEENTVCKKKVNNCENSVFRVIFVRKEKDLLGSGPFSRYGRVTGNKHIFLLGLSNIDRVDGGCSKVYVHNAIKAFAH